MSLHHIAKHLESQGRGPDTMLVHMAPNEVHALNEFAKANGTHLTINPKTGLPEAGLLSTLLGAGLAAFTGWDPMMIAAGVGVADAALTGSLGQGLMAGLGAWSGAGMAGNISRLAGADAIKNASDVTNISDLTTNAAANVPNPTISTNIGMGGAGNMVDTTGGLSNIGQVGTQAAGPVMPGAVNPNGTMSAQDMYNANTANQANQIASKITPQSTSDMGQNFNNFTSGMQKLVTNPFDSVKQMWNMPATDNLPSGKTSLISTGLTAAPYIIKAFQPSPYVPPTAQNNPFGLKTLSSEFQGYNPQGGSPYFQAQYRNYQTNPYMPGVMSSARGGLQDIPKYSGATDSMINLSQKLLTTPYKEAPIIPTDPGSAYGGPGIVEYEKEYEGMSPTQRTEAKMKALFGNKIAVSPFASLGAISTDPAIVAQQAIQDAQNKQSQSAKEGGLQGYAQGGLGSLGGYSDGGRLLKGPGDGVSDSIPASIGHRQPARLAEGEFVIPARIVSELGNGSTDAGAKRLYAMMDRIKAKRAKVKDIAADTKTYNLLPA
jgi:hypothetical protein